jgi:two-component sensor histidine kinase
MSRPLSTSALQFSPPPELESETLEERRLDGLTTALRAAITREEALRRKLIDLSQFQSVQFAEVEHRLFNGLQRIASLLSLQARTASPEAAAEMVVAVGRIIALGNVHRRLRLVNDQEDIEFKQYLHPSAATFRACFWGKAATRRS